MLHKYKLMEPKHITERNVLEYFHNVKAYRKRILGFIVVYW